MTNIGWLLIALVLAISILNEPGKGSLRQTKQSREGDSPAWLFIHSFVNR